MLDGGKQSQWRQDDLVFLIRRYHLVSADRTGDGSITSTLHTSGFPIGVEGEPADLIPMVTCALFIRWLPCPWRYHEDGCIICSLSGQVIWCWCTRQQEKVLISSNSMWAFRGTVQRKNSSISDKSFNISFYAKQQATFNTFVVSSFVHQRLLHES